MRKEDFLETALNKRREQHAFRQLRLPGGKIDFCSNDYLGLARSERVQEEALTISRQLAQVHGSGGSRLLAGNYELVEEAERVLASFHETPAGLIYNSGYDANLGLFSAVPQKGDTIIYDQLIHASIRDGVRLSAAQSFSFIHNSVEDLQKKILAVDGRVFVAVESVYSMDGDMALLAEITALCDKLGAFLIVDEAHATGVIGPKGEGLMQALGLSCFARVHTFGKAVGCHGAIVLGSVALRDFLINFSRSFIYTTALPPHAVAVILAAYDIFPDMHLERAHLSSLIAQFRKGVPGAASETPIQVVMAPGNEQARQLAHNLQQEGLDVRAILHPTVPRGQERLRVVLHSFNTAADVERLITAINI
ncbi:aminotransferase class I/II-fold pyridoxal phosphate-dependent enzyme [Chitinophaga sp. SYP-B3965]|uniref:aminotransferase class I/II-fold pyridoxal phosphate-dependent enzyme n=1 Tax=Chitinophaga sp. SYP-B3965 TaxID=2663120 RepID=UPI001299D983|nr:pyridoxal phosphate-dependent aminotransferase family protein [Chitinophaga sp. SYP-B3965]MRG45359.1 aminotransferase class I/II-fold pyridoxal phosphate-dependent enzyme [Chitinophaga sp. SYP-B3965]